MPASCAAMKAAKATHSGLQATQPILSAKDRKAFAAGVIAGNERSRSGTLLKAAKHALGDVAAANQDWKN